MYLPKRYTVLNRIELIFVEHSVYIDKYINKCTYVFTIKY